MLSVLRPPCDADLIRAGRETPGCASHAKPWVLAASILGSSVVFLEASVVNVALPAIQEGLHASVGQMQWISSTMTLFLATLTLVAGSAGDRFGRRRLFTIGLGVIAVGSVVAGFAVSSAQLIFARALQGLGGALLVPNSLALLSAAFPRAERGRAIGTWSAYTALTNASGPIIGGLLVDVVSWRAGFLMVVPLALGTMVMAETRVSDVRIGQHRTEIDWRGAIVATAGLTLLVFGVIKGSAAGWLSLGAGLALLATFVWLESHASSPMMPPRLFRSRTFLGVNVLTLLLYFAVTGVFFVLPFELVRARGYSATATGASFLPFALIVAGLSRWTGGLVDHFGARLPLVVGPLLISAGLLLFAMPVGESYATAVLVPMAAAGLGMAVTVAPLTTTVMASVDESEVGVASGVNNTIARVAALLAIAIFGLVALQVYGSALAQNLALLELSPAVRSAVASQAGSLGDVTIPETASFAERESIQQATAAALSASFRWAALLAAVLAAAGALCAAVLVDPAAASVAADAAGAHSSCTHEPLIQDVSPRGEGCPDCLRIGSDWVHLRMCLTCGYVGCCDASRNHHATSHFWATGHPIVCSLEPGETWRWCYLDDVVV